MREVTDPLWDEMLALLGPAKDQSGGFDAALVFSAGAAASAAQRRRLAERMNALGMKSKHICLLSNSAIVRATVPALARLLRMGTVVSSYKTIEWQRGLDWLAQHYTFDRAAASASFLEACRRTGVPTAMIEARAA